VKFPRRHDSQLAEPKEPPPPGRQLPKPENLTRQARCARIFYFTAIEIAATVFSHSNWSFAPGPSFDSVIL